MIARFVADPARDSVGPESFGISAAGPEGFTVRHRFAPCAGCTPQSEQFAARLSGPGRFTMLRDGKITEHWVHWIDDDHRMAAIGTPDGRFGWIMAKEGFEDRGDLVRAAKEVLEWQGYDMTRLVEIKT